ncbi:RICIN domain-containing protein [Cellulomonas marina]|nr:RICIN domain-containing protein [Cellulomonas marina]GIG29130.1 hypothetical protein Cma02nite_17300 [Cellulomonas marina]
MPRPPRPRRTGVLRPVARALALRREALVGRGAPPDAGVAMLSALLVILLMTALSVVVMGVVLQAALPGQYQRKSTRSVFAAEAGIEAAVSRIRSAGSAADFTGTVYGDLAQLPCSVQGTVAAAVPGTSAGAGAAGAAGLGYTASIAYYKDDPAGRDAAWLAANAMPCAAGGGVATQPRYARIASAGVVPGGPLLEAGEGDRTIVSVYRFRTTNTNVAGGRIWTLGHSYCLRATSDTAGSAVTYAAADTCGADDVRELWIWDSTYGIKLAVTTSPGQTPLCVTGPPTASSPTVDALLQPCRSDAGRWNQLWSWQGGARWQGENQAITNYSAYCLSAGTTSTTIADLRDRRLSIGTSCASNAEWGSFDPDPAVGPGAASVSTRQVVSYLEFGRCFDVTNEQVGFAYMIVYPCKQDPSGGSLLKWNHKWYYEEPVAPAVSRTQQISVLRDNSTAQRYCLQTPAPGSGSSYPTLTSACSATAADQQWTRFADTGDYRTSWTFVDHLGRCIDLGERGATSWSRLVVTSCTGGPGQKWNALPEQISATLGNYLEPAG